MTLNSRVGEAPDDHGQSWSSGTYERRGHPVADGQNCVDHRKARVTVSREIGVLTANAVQDRLLQTKSQIPRIGSV